MELIHVMTKCNNCNEHIELFDEDIINEKTTCFYCKNEISLAPSVEDFCDLNTWIEIW